MFVDDLLKDKRVLVTGGGTGLGKIMAVRAATLGADVVICGRRADVLAQAAEEIAQAGGRPATPLVCDVRDSAAVEAMMAQIWRTAPLDILVNNAAGNFNARTETLSARAIDSVLNIVLHGTLYCTTAAGRRWIEQRRPGTVLSIVTTAAFHGLAYTVPSAAAKAGVLAMTRSLAVEWGPKGIRLVALAPGYFPTDGAWERLYPPEVTVEPQEDGVPLRRLGHPDELADTAAFLMSDRAAYVNGECLVIDGGRWLQGVGGANTRTLAGLSDPAWEALRRR